MDTQQTMLIKQRCLQGAHPMILKDVHPFYVLNPPPLANTPVEIREAQVKIC